MPDGLQHISELELVEKCQNYRRVWIEQGSICFTSTTNGLILINAKNERGLRSIDRLLGFAYRGEIGSTSMDCHNLEKLPDNIDWENACKCWQTLGVKDIDPTTARTDITFRVTTERKGKHEYKSMEASIIFGGAVNDHFEWKAKMLGYDIEILLYIRDNTMYFGIVLCDYNPILNSVQHKLSKRNRSAVGVTTLNSAICFCMCKLADIQPFEIVVDPLAGVGTIPIEGGQVWNNNIFFAGDIENEETSSIAENISKFGTNNNIMHLQWNAKHLPLKV
eukprot:TRINITY_DN278_c1_g1_i2.p1 TRINITY_DN278_c1_g1~~TRINITY_DN278_c1_g1_i2.p1  ORF type:complete len:306 (+),score=51.65 TRINITY_DN278_c1_g1_i2:85-918(+)